MSAIVIRVMGTNRSMVRHHCGQRMQHLETYLLGGIDASDWWCNRCAEAEQMWGDEDDPKTPKTEAPNTMDQLRDAAPTVDMRRQPGACETGGGT